MHDGIVFHRTQVRQRGGLIAVGASLAIAILGLLLVALPGSLPGVGPSTAQAIVDHRSTNGPFGSIEDLLSVKGIGPAKFEAMRKLVGV